METNLEQTHEQIVKRYNAKKAIFQAMTNGRHISLLNSLEFGVAEMHTTICNIRAEIDRKNLPVVLRDKWFEHNGKRMKEYWFENKTN